MMVFHLGWMEERHCWDYVDCWVEVSMVVAMDFGRSWGSVMVDEAVVSWVLWFVC